MGRGTVSSPFSFFHLASSLILVSGSFMELVLSTRHAPFCLTLIIDFVECFIFILQQRERKVKEVK